MSESEVFLARLWREAMGVEEITPYDNFFELGGHSLLAISVLEEIEETRGVRLTPVDLVSQTLAQLAASLDRGDSGGSGPADDDRAGGATAEMGRGRQVGPGGMLGKLLGRRRERDA